VTSETFTFLGAAEYRLTEIDFYGQVVSASGSDSDTWVDPIIGIKGRLNSARTSISPHGQ
jgi:hypothetical protein